MYLCCFADRHKPKHTVYCCRILGPAVYVFLASVVPALAFGVQIDEATGRKLV